MRNFFTFCFGIFEGLLQAAQNIWDFVDTPIRELIVDLPGTWDNATLLEFSLLASGLTYIIFSIIKFILR